MTLEERFWAKVAADGPVAVEALGPCWLWTGFIDRAGYSRIREGGRATPVLYGHRVSVELDGRIIPEGMKVDHLCRVRHCVNPSHLEVVTNRENILRGDGEKVRLHHAGRCANGHSASEASRRKGSGAVVYCRACRREGRAAA